MRRRAERQLETRRRITESAVELHSTIGPSRTTIAAVARKAGVQRHTVYAHFPDELSLYRACSQHDLAADPLPDVSKWLSISDPERRLRVGLDELFRYFQRHERMLTNVRRDLELVPELLDVSRPWTQHWQQARDALASGFEKRGRRGRSVLAVAGLVADFGTWEALARQGIDHEEAVSLAARLVLCAAASGGRLQAAQRRDP